MTIIVAQNDTALAFCLVGDTYISVKNREEMIDSRVLDHQLTTGQTWRGSPISEKLLKVMHLAHEQGARIPPLYGMIQGAYRYEFRFTPEGLLLHCLNGETGDTLELAEHAPVIQPITEFDASIEYMVFSVNELSYQWLVAWEYWEAQQAYNSRYYYRFVPTTIGCFVVVYDSESGSEIDLTDWGCRPPD
ncbi:MAG: hypothetical protein GFH27_549285n102 [Chloroflexi bacterium AL-W]|nr:hypothetical protein [Chloroflexi bacterium AL-N1]NOK65614.1 hypothetical protein [Chloroflexi bacterium AL-N10]NOK74445.1 hypothetical protein [Chloroflexi bacterium AL-N5]NOK80647.1 hypothetical protein [Chloroflexi bacterium AL-W]NOK88703.1 hypothetical protein [Chloroflexi bacterium AL-N15]